MGPSWHLIVVIGGCTIIVELAIIIIVGIVFAWLALRRQRQKMDTLRSGRVPPGGEDG